MFKLLLNIAIDFIAGTFKHRLRALMVFIVVALLVVLIRQVSLISSVRHTNEALARATIISEKIVSLGSLIHQFTNTCYTDYDFVQTGESANTVRVRQDYLRISAHLDTLSGAGILSNETSHQLFEIRNQTERIWREYNTTLILLREKGNDRGGLISDWNTSITTLQSTYTGDPVMEATLARADQLMARYILVHDQSLINQISDLTQAGSSLASDSGFFAFSGEGLGQLANIAGLIAQKDLLIGFGSGSGTLAVISALQESVGNSLNTVQEELTHLRTKFNRRALRGTWIFYGLLLAGLLGAIYDLRKALLARLGLLQSVSRGLADGAVPQIPQLEGKDELTVTLAHLGQFTADLSQKTEFARAISGGQYQIDYSPLSADDLLGKELLSLRENLVRTSEEEKRIAAENQKRQWANEGISIFADILRQNSNNLDVLCEAVIQQLVKYLKASVGGLFLVDDSDKRNVMLHLKSMFAYNRQKYLQKSYAMGEGLIGACAFERKNILLTEIPDDYLEITSGLGESNPGCILLVPLRLENAVLGVVEIASFTPLADHEIEFVEKLGESIASTLTSVRINQQTSELLKKSQLQAAEMAEQEEEMRQNMEELQATQEESSRREKEIGNILSSIKASTLFIEYDASGYITDINDKFMYLLETQREQLLNMHYSALSNQKRDSESFQQFWGLITKGHSQRTIDRIRVSDAREVWVEQFFSPILNLRGDVYKVFSIAFDLTEYKRSEENFDQRNREMLRKSLEIEVLQSAIDDALIKCELGVDGVILRANNNFAEIMGVQLADLIGKEIFKFLDNAEKNTFKRLWTPLLENKPQKEVMKHILPDDETRWVMATLTPMKNEFNDVYKIYYLGQDITKEQMRYELLTEANKEIERLNRLLNEKI